MGKIVGYVAGQNYVRRYKLGATAAANPGVPHLMVATTGNVGKCTTTACADAIGFSVGVGVYSTVQNDAEGTIEIDINPFAIGEFAASGAATEGTALSQFVNTSASAGGTILTATIPTGDYDGGTLWRYQNGLGGESRTITTQTSTTDLRVTVPFTGAIAVGDIFLMSPYNETGNGAAGGDGNSQVQLTTLLTQADFGSTTATGTGIKANVVELILRGTTDTLVQFVLGDHVFNGLTTT